MKKCTGKVDDASHRRAFLKYTKVNSKIKSRYLNYKLGALLVAFSFFFFGQTWSKTRFFFVFVRSIYVEKYHKSITKSKDAINHFINYFIYYQTIIQVLCSNIAERGDHKKYNQPYIVNAQHFKQTKQTIK